MTGVPTEADLAEIHSPLALSVFDKLVNHDAKKSFEEVLPTAPPDAIDLIKKCLQFRPSKRPSAVQALEHEFLKEFHDPSKEPICTRKMNMPIDDNKKMEARNYRDYVHNIIKKKNEEIKEKRREQKYQDKMK